MLFPSLETRRRARTADGVSAIFAVTSRQQLPEREELLVQIADRPCRLVIWSFGSSVSVGLRTPVLPPGIRVLETSLYGPQKQEAWQSGEAAQTGDLEFDRAFNVVAAPPDEKPDPLRVREIAPAVRTTLLRHRVQIRDASVDNQYVALEAVALGTGTKRPTEEHFRELVRRALELAKDLEAAAS